MSWNRRTEVRVTHLPSGHVVRIEAPPESLHRLRERAMRILRARLAAPRLQGPLDVVRCYEVPDGAWSTPELDGAVHIGH